MQLFSVYYYFLSADYLNSCRLLVKTRMTNFFYNIRLAKSLAMSNGIQYIHTVKTFHRCA